MKIESCEQLVAKNGKHYVKVKIGGWRYSVYDDELVEQLKELREGQEVNITHEPDGDFRKLTSVEPIGGATAKPVVSLQQDSVKAICLLASAIFGAAKLKSETMSVADVIKGAQYFYDWVKGGVDATH